MTAESAPGHGSVVRVALQAGSRSNEEPSVVVRRVRSGQWLVLAIAGEMDLQAGPLLSDVGDDPFFAVFDLQGVNFMDCSGLRVLQNAQRRALAAGGSVRLAAVSKQALRLLMLTRLDRAFPLFDSVRDATSLPLSAVPGADAVPCMPGASEGYRAALPGEPAREGDSWPASNVRSPSANRSPRSGPTCRISRPRRNGTHRP